MARTTRPVTLVLALAILLAGCGDGSAEDSNTTTTVVTAVTTSSSSTTAPAGVRPLANTSPVSAVPAGSGGVAYLTAVRSARQAESDRVTFEFDGPLPGYVIEYADAPLQQGGSGDSVAIAGGAVLSVQFTPASGVDLSSGARPTYTGPARIAPADAPIVTEVVRVSDYEAELLWGIGVERRNGFAVSRLQNPSRVVIDFSE